MPTATAALDPGETIAAAMRELYDQLREIVARGPTDDPGLLDELGKLTGRVRSRIARARKRAQASTKLAEKPAPRAADPTPAKPVPATPKAVPAATPEPTKRASVGLPEPSAKPDADRPPRTAPPTAARPTVERWWTRRPPFAVTALILLAACSSPRPATRSSCSAARRSA